MVPDILHPMQLLSQAKLASHGMELIDRASDTACMARKKSPPGHLLKQKLSRPLIDKWREHREEMTQEALASRVADLLGTSFSTSTLSRIENAKSPYSQRQLEAIAIALRCEPWELLNVDPTKPDAIWSISEQLKTASPEKQSEIRNVIDVLLKTG